MINMMKADIYRLSKSKGMYIYALILLISYAATIIYRESGGVTFGAPLNAPEGVKLDIQQLGFNFTYYFLLLIPVFGIISADLSERTVKNTISSGVSRKDYFISKSVFAFIYSLIVFIIPNYLFYFINRIMNGEKFSTSFAGFSKALFMQLPMIAGLISVFIFFAFFLRKGAVFNAVTIVTPILYTTASLIMYGISATKHLAEGLLKYELSVMIYSLAVGCSDSFRIRCYMINAGMIAFSAIAGYLAFTKRELD